MRQSLGQVFDLRSFYHKQRFIHIFRASNSSLLCFRKSHLTHSFCLFFARFLFFHHLSSCPYTHAHFPLIPWIVIPIISPYFGSSHIASRDANDENILSPLLSLSSPRELFRMKVWENFKANLWWTHTHAHAVSVPNQIFFFVFPSKFFPSHPFWFFFFLESDFLVSLVILFSIEVFLNRQKD